MMIRLIFLNAFFALLVSCTQSHTNGISEDAGGFIGKWKALKRPYPFHGALTINADHTFSYTGGSCNARFTSVGEWLGANNTIILTSKAPESCCWPEDFVIKCFTIDSVKAQKPRAVRKDCIPPPETIYITFNKEMFYILADTLLHKSDPDALCAAEIRLDFTRINKRHTGQTL